MRFSRYALLTTSALVLATSVAHAQETTSSIRGTVVDPTGSPVGGATVRVIHEPTGTASTLTTSSSGSFQAAGLRVGGPYTVVIETPAFQNEQAGDIFLTLGETERLFFDLEATGAAEVDSLVVTGTVATAPVALGPSTTFNSDDLQRLPTINRDIKDVLRVDPRIYIDESFARGIQCLGANPRFNSLTVDGIRKNDGFGLNSNGFPTNRQPFPFDAIDQVSVEFSPFDVEYGGFTACNINAVTKSGGNELSGSAFFDYTSDHLRGNSLNGDDIDTGSYTEKRYGGILSGPIWQDKIFWLVGYEKLEGADLFDRGPVGSAFARQPISQADYDRILDIARTVYDYEPGEIVGSLPVEDEKVIARLDWNITNDHRAQFIFNYNDGFNISQSDSDDDEFEYLNHYYERGHELYSYVGSVFSDWTDNLSTELRIGYTDVQNRQISLGGTDFGEVQIEEVPNPQGGTTTVYLGADDSRHANQLSYDIFNAKLAANYAWGDHLITVGYEREAYDIFNLFIQEAEGEYRFDTIDDFENGLPSRITFENASPSLVPEDAAAEFSYAINTIYAQDEWFLPTYDLTVVAGLRYDWYTSSDLPRENPNVEARYGFSNQQNLDGKGVLQPRFGFTWDAIEDLTVRGGVGLYAGGNPNVWISNNYSNDGVTQVEAQLRGTAAAFSGLTFVNDEGGLGRPFYGVPQQLVDAVSSGTADSGINVLDPDFEIPREWKFALGGTYDFDAGFLGDNYRVQADFIYSIAKDPAIIQVLQAVEIGETFEGRPIYRNVDFLDPACDTSPATCTGRGFDFDFVLTNSDREAHSKSFSVALSKYYDWGFDWSVAYAYVDAEEVSPMTSSVAFSNYANINVVDPNNPAPGTANYNIPHRFTMRFEYERELVEGFKSTISLFGQVNQGRPYSAVFDGVGFDLGSPIPFIDQQLLYIPTGPTDPNVVFAPGFDTAGFFDYLADSGLDQFAGGIAERNSQNSDWWSKFDLRVEQEVPGLFENHTGAFYIVFENIGNLINDDWGVLREASFPRGQQIVDASYDPATDQYTYEEFIGERIGRVTQASLWEIRLGVRYEF